MVLQRGKCGYFVLINKWHSWVQSALCGIWLYMQYGSNELNNLPCWQGVQKLANSVQKNEKEL